MAGLSSAEHAKRATQHHAPIRHTFYRPDFASLSLTTAPEIVESMSWAHPSCRTARATLSELQRQTAEQVLSDTMMSLGDKRYSLNPTIFPPPRASPFYHPTPTHVSNGSSIEKMYVLRSCQGLYLSRPSQVDTRTERSSLLGEEGERMNHANTRGEG